MVFLGRIREDQEHGTLKGPDFVIVILILVISGIAGLIFRSESVAGDIFLGLDGTFAVMAPTSSLRPWLRHRRYQRYLDQGTMMTRTRRRRWADEVEAELWRRRPRWTRIADKVIAGNLPEPTRPTDRNLMR